jgi:RHS repeat-associated protein
MFCNAQNENPLNQTGDQRMTIIGRKKNQMTTELFSYEKISQSLKGQPHKFLLHISRQLVHLGGWQPRLSLSAIVSWAVIVALLVQTIAPTVTAANNKSESSSSKSKPVNSIFTRGKGQNIVPQDIAVEAATVRRLGSLNGRIEGSVRQLNAEDVTLNGGAVITSALLVPGTPDVRLNGNPNFGGTVQGTGNLAPSNYRVTLNSNSTLDRLVNRVDPVQLPVVTAPPAATGTRDVSLNNASDSAGDFATLRDLTLNGNAGTRTVPPGTYRNFRANGNSGFIFGVAGSSQPSVYNLNALDLNGNARLQIAGAVILTIGSQVSLNGAVGSSNDPLLLTLKVSTGGVTLNGGASIYGIVQAPNGTVTINGNSLLQGSVACDRLTINGNGTLKGTAGALTSINPTTAVQGQTLTVSLQGINTHWIAGQTRASFGGEIAVGSAAEGEFGNLQVLGSSSAVATLVVSPTAALAPRTVRVTTPVAGFSEGAVEVLIDAFTVTANPAPGAGTATVSTLAGSGVAGFTDSNSTQAQFRNPAGIAAGANDALYIADAGNHSIRKIVADGTVTTVAGNGTTGFADGSGAAARFNNPQGVAVDANGIVYVADSGNHRIRRIAADGAVTTLAGDGTAGLTNGQGAQARFNAPQGITVDNSGGLYIADTGNNVVRYLSATGEVSTVAGDGTVGAGDAPARFNSPVGVAFDGTTLFVYLADSSNHRIRRVTQGGSVITIAGAGRGFADGTATQARFADPSGIAVDGAGKLIVTEATNSLLRMVDVVKATSGAAGAVTTIAGTGGRGLTNGAGNVARFNTPRGIVVLSSSAMIVADTGNNVLRKITLPPAITSFNPVQSQTGQTITINGERFDGRAPANNIVKFVRSAQAGGGTTQAQVVTATRNQLTVVIPQDATTGNITVQTEGGTAVSSTAFTIVVSPPVISDFNPKRGAVGTQVTLFGNDLMVGAATPAVTFAGANGARLNALVNSANASQVRVTVPNAAVTGVIQLTNANGSAVTGQVFVVEGGALDYQLTLAPTVASAVQRTNATYVIYATASSSSFSQLIRLSVSGLPAGVSASFEPEQITGGATSTLKLNLANANLAAGNYPFTISGSALVDGSDMIRNAAGSLTVVAAGQTTLSGRVMSTDNEPVIGATVSLDGKTATTDAAGGFLLVGIIAGTDRPLMVDGRTASAPNRTYPIILEPATIAANQANINPYIFYLPPIDTQYEVTVIPNQNTVVSTPRLPGIKAVIPAGANLRNRDGSPVTRVSITPVPIDRTPAPIPANVTTSQVFTIQPGGAISDIAVPITYPNLSGANPGVRVDLYAFDHDLVKWYIYGYGRVSSDGRLIEPEIDPATGRPYGLRTFSWYMAGTPTAGEGNPAEADCGNKTGNPVDLSSGVKTESMVEIAFGGARGGLALGHTFTTDLSGAGVVGRFGRGTKDNFDIRLTGTFEANGAGRMVMPEQVTGRLFSYAMTEADGSLLFTSTATIEQLGDVLKKFTDGTFAYRYVDGSVMRFDATGRLTAMVDTNGNTTTLTYTGANLTQISDAVGRSITLEYDSSNRINKATDPLGRVWRYGYTGDIGLLATVTDPLDHILRYGYEGSLLTSITDKRGNLVKEILYDVVNRRVIEQRFAEGKSEHYDYTLSGTTVTGVTITDSLGRKISRRFNPKGHTIEMTDALGQSSRIERDLATGLPISTIGACGCGEATQEFDARGNVTAMTDRLGQTTRMEYEPVLNRLIKVTDKLGRITLFAYDNRGNLVSLTDALNQVTTMAYDQYGELTSVTDPLGHTKRMEYDAQGNITGMIDALNHRTTLEYDGIGRMTAVMDELNHRSSLTYDALSRVLTLTDQTNATSILTYDENGNLLTATNANGNQVRKTYDEHNRITTLRDAMGNIGRIVYNSEDEITALISPLGRQTTYSYDKRGQIATMKDPMQGEVKFTYDNRGSVVALSDQRGNTTTYSYDELFRPVSMRDPLGRESRVTYDAMNQVTESFDRLGRRVQMVYDAIDRLTSTVYADATVTYSYDAASRPMRIDDTQSGFVSWNYDAGDRLLSETTVAGVVSYGYNIVDQLTSMTAADRQPVNYGYDAAGRLQSITQGSESFTYAYDTISRLTSFQRPNGVNTSYDYDANGRLTHLLHQDAQSQPLEEYRYTYTADSEIDSITSQNSLPLLPQAKNASSANAANRVSQSGVANYSFDNTGQTTSKTDASGTTTYKWDARGRMTSASLPDGQSVNYGYDALGRRSSRTANGSTTSFLYDGMDVVLDKASDGSSVNYLGGFGVDDKLRQTSSASPNSPAYFLQDHLGSTVALTDASGGVSERQQYEPFGASSGSGLTRYGYTGREKDGATGLMYYRARWYDPQQGRFLSQDPLGLRGGLNLYAYAGNDPVNVSDPFGLRGGPVNYARDPAHPEDWGINALDNTVSDILDLDTVAEAGWALGDPCVDTFGRWMAGAYLAARVAENLLGLGLAARGGAATVKGGAGLVRRFGKGGYSINPIEWFRAKAIADRAIDSGIAVKRVWGPSQVLVDGAGPRIELNRFASRTASIEEYLHAKNVRRALGRGDSIAKVTSAETILLEELRTKSRMIRAAGSDYLGVKSLPVDTKGLIITLNEYRAQYETLLKSRPGPK